MFSKFLTLVVTEGYHILLWKEVEPAGKIISGKALKQVLTELEGLSPSTGDLRGGAP